jgi:hypothetical protein
MHVAKSKKDLKIGINQKIVFYWIIILPIIGFLISVIELNPVLILILIGLLLLALGLNRASKIVMSNESIIITKTNFIFFKTYKKEVDLNLISNLTIEDLGFSYLRTDSTIYGSGILGLYFISGYFFYYPSYSMKFRLANNDSFEITVNTQKIDIEKLSKRLATRLSTRYEFLKFEMSQVERFKRELLEKDN